MYVSPSVLMVYGLPWSGDNKHEDITRDAGRKHNGGQ